MIQADHPRHRAVLALCRRRWLDLPLEERRRHLARAAELLGPMAGVRGWVEVRAWDLAGIHRHEVRREVTSDAVAALVLEHFGGLLDDDGPEAAQEAAGFSPRASLDAEAGPREVWAPEAAPAGSQGP